MFAANLAIACPILFWLASDDFRRCKEIVELQVMESKLAKYERGNEARLDRRLNLKLLIYFQKEKIGLSLSDVESREYKLLNRNNLTIFSLAIIPGDIEKKISEIEKRNAVISKRIDVLEAKKKLQPLTMAEDAQLKFLQATDRTQSIKILNLYDDLP